MSENEKDITYNQGESADELDEYGTWVTNEAQEASSDKEEEDAFSWDVMDNDHPLEAGDQNEESDLEYADISLDEENMVPDELSIEQSFEPETAKQENAAIDEEDSKDLEQTKEEALNPKESEKYDSEYADISLDEENTMPIDNELPVEQSFEPETAKQENAAIDEEDSKDLEQTKEEALNPKESENSNIIPKLLETIIQELTLIREGFDIFRQGIIANKAPQYEEAAPEEESAPVEDVKNEGFFDEEDDEKIALTGDELENILMTSDFTEESGSDVAEAEFDSNEIEFPPPEKEEGESEVSTLPLDNTDIPEKDIAYLEEDPYVDGLPEQMEASDSDNLDSILDLDSIISESIFEAESEIGKIEKPVKTAEVNEEAETETEDAFIHDDDTPIDGSLNNDMINETLSEDVLNKDNLAEDELLGGGAEEKPAQTPSEAVPSAKSDTFFVPPSIKDELSLVLCYMDQLLEALPDEKIKEFAQSEYFDTYKKLFKELGLG